MISKVTSFDVFDTALERRVYEPTDIFKLIEKKVGKNFFSKRIEAEKKAREKKPFYNLDDIYEFLPEFSKEDEIKEELDNCIINEDIFKIYNETEGDKIFISDMYLPSAVISQMLEKVGYKNPEVFVSCEQKARKGDGELFKKVCKLKKCKIVKHYGDNYMGDIEGAKKAGISEVSFNVALHNKELNIPMVKNPKLKKCFALASNKLEATDKMALYVAPLVSEFTKWVISKRKKGQKIFFCSRDMIVPYRLATEVLKEPDVYYIHVSRRSLAPVAYKMNAKEVIDHLGEAYSKEDMESLKKIEVSSVLEYLRKFDFKNGDIIADTGYRGTSQILINKALGIKLKGLYIGIKRLYAGLDAEQYLERPAVKAGMLLETPLGSPEDNVVGYKNGEVLYAPENKERKEQAEQMTSFLFKVASMMLEMSIDAFDVEQAFLHLQAYPDLDIINEYNRPIYVNRGSNESIVGFDPEHIKRGELKESYEKSYCKHFYKKLLESDNELRYLSKYL